MVIPKTAWPSAFATRKLRSNILVNMFGRPRQGRLWATVVCLVFGMIEGTSVRVGQAQATVNVKVKNTSEVFSPQWVEEYFGDK